jgi:hypothetical protein
LPDFDGYGSPLEITGTIESATKSISFSFLLLRNYFEKTTPLAKILIGTFTQ